MADIAIVCALGGPMAGMKVLENIYKPYDHFFIIWKGSDALKTKIGRSYIISNPVSSSQKKVSIISYLKWQIIQSINIIQIIIKENPKIIISTGPSGLAVPAFYFGRFLGAKTIFIENIGRFNPSPTGKMVYPIVDKFFVRDYSQLKKYGQKVEFYDDYKKSFIRIKTNLYKKKIIFVTIGTSNYQFNRLIKKMDDIAPKLPLPVVMQIGKSDYKPKNTRFFSFCGSDELKKYYEIADIVVGHVARGTFLDMVGNGVKGIMLPRRAEYGEAINNHQQEHAKSFREMGIMIAKNEQNLEDLLLYHRDELAPIKLNLEKGNQRLVRVIREYIDRVLINN